MQLKKLEAYGFKSFADKIEIEFGRGVTAVVGPNGSGKSNITDAIRWVLGEQNVRELRGMKAEDIIFTGSSARRPMGLAEVSLTFEDASEIGEAVITRRLYRSGESEYYMNKSRCRLKDIYSLLADTGLGHDGVSVISQNRMDDILNSRPEERRLFLEETAGITKYRDRKRESLRKLEDTQKNLVRVADILAEVAAQLASLHAEAEKTRAYNEKKEELQRCSITALLRSHEKFVAAETALAKKRGEYQAEETEAQADAARAQARREEIEKSIIGVESRIQEYTKKRDEAHDSIEKRASEIRVLEERRRQGDDREKRLFANDKKLAASEEKAADELCKLQKTEAALNGSKADAEKKFAAESEKFDALSKKIREAKDTAMRLEAERSKAERDVIAGENELKIINHELESEKTAGEGQNKSVAEAEARLLENLGELERLKEKSEALALERESLAKTYSECTAKIGEIESGQMERRAVMRAARQYIEQAGAKLELLKKMQQTYEGFGRAAKAVLTCRESWRKKVSGAVAELIETPKEYLTAIEVALGGSQQNIVTEDSETAKKAIEFLKRTRAGRATFLPLTTLTPRRPEDEAVKKMPGVIGYCSEVVKTSKKYEKVRDFLLSRTLLVDTLDAAISVSGQRRQSIRIVTMEGELISPGGSIAGGSRDARESGFMGRAGEIGTWEKTLAEQSEKEKLAMAGYESAREEIETLEKKSNDTRSRLDDVRVMEAELRGSIEKMESSTRAERTRLSAMKTLAEEMARTFAAAEEKRVSLTRKLKESRERYAALEEEATSSRETLEDMEQDAEDFRKLLNNLEMKKFGLSQETLRVHQQVIYTEKELRRIRDEREKNRREVEALVAGLLEGGEQIETLKDEMKRFQDDFSEMDARIKKIYVRKTGMMTESREEEQAAAAARQRLAKIHEKLHQTELEASKVQIGHGQCLDELMDVYGLTAESAVSFAMDISAAALSSRISEIEKGLAALGAVNPGAIEEYERQRERYDSISGQMGDMQRAQDDLKKLIAEIDATMTRQFMEAFLKIRQAFQEIFTKLFGGGQAELLLTDEKRVLESGVEIAVRLPDKRQQNLSVLSGGERALTVIALLFAFLRVRPAPFSVLDEIDAPLDEANIARFGKFLREFSKDTQFVIVTHRKGTMEAADAMYGVTLEDAGVSKIISVKLGDS